MRTTDDVQTPVLQRKNPLKLAVVDVERAWVTPVAVVRLIVVKDMGLGRQVA